eukprot:g1918.t1
MEERSAQKGDVVHRALSAAWFCIFATLAFQGRFMSLFLHERGFSDAEIGGILSVKPLVSVLTTPIFSFASDVAEDPRYVLGLLIPFSVLTVDGYILADRLTSPSSRLAVFMGLYSLWSFAFSPICSIFDAQTLLLLESVQASSSQYGHSRLWGAVSWGIVNAAIIGPIIDVTSSTWVLVYGFTVSAIVCLCVLVVVLRPSGRSSEDEKIELQTMHDVEIDATKLSTSDEDKDVCDLGDARCVRASKEEQKGGYAKLRQDREEDSVTPVPPPKGTSLGTRFASIRRLFIDAQGQTCWMTVIFFFLIFTMSIGTTLVEGLVFLYFAEDMEASSSMCGVSVLVTIVFELPLFYYSEKVLQSMNVHTLNLVAATAYCIRVVVYTLLPSPWYVLLVEPLHGITFACHQLACIEYISAISHRAKDLKTTAQGLRSATQSLGSFVGSAVGGLVMQSYGSTVMYRGAAAIVFCVAATYAICVSYMLRAQIRR